MRAFTISYQPFALITTLILAHYESWIDTRLRNLWGYTLFFAFSLSVIVLDLATSGKGGIGTFIGLCTIFACFGIAHVVVQGGVFGELAFLCVLSSFRLVILIKYIFFLVSIVEIIL